MASMANVKLGVCSVTYNGVDLGHTKGGVTVTYEQDIYDVTVDKYGSTPAEKVLIGEKMMAEVPLAEATIANLLVAISQGTTGGSGTRVDIGGQVGDKLGDDAKTLVLHPIAVAAGTLTEDVVIRKAISTANVELAYMVDDVRVVPVTFEGLIDETQDDGKMLGLIGNSAAA